MPDSNENWLTRNKNKLGVATFIGLAALTLAELGEVKNDIAESAHWTVPAIAGAETVATAGLAAMIASTGNKIGNPLSIRKRLTELHLKNKLSNSRTFRIGAYLNLAGATGTGGVIATETVASFPVSAWPASLGVAGLSVALSAPFYRIARSKDRSIALNEKVDEGQL